MSVKATSPVGFDHLMPPSQGMIQRQLHTLYDTPIPNPINNGPRHLINHQVNWLKTSDESTPEKQIIDQQLQGYIHCPEVKFLNDEKDGERTLVRIKYKFRHADKGEVTPEQTKEGRRMNSVFLHKEPYMSKDGAKIRLNETDASSEIIIPASSPKNNMIMFSAMRDTLINLGKEKIPVTSLYCKMDLDTLFPSCKILDAQGKKPSDLKTSDGKEMDIDFIIDCVLSIIHHQFCRDEKDNLQGIACSPDKPFVFGYSVPRKINNLILITSPNNIIPSIESDGVAPQHFYVKP
ncbi:hypothetical protein I302_108755 [Kwoniella bestiolae CBS 10118]|uniref:Uncharacterized protein n=1 Tax=Kwoniella bestiolae CBS 10118 TaxID=1296100 RepID=A0AAJ8KEY0_9TREE